MAGYSGTPLPRKLGIKEKFRVTFVGLPSDVKAELEDALAQCAIVKDGRGPLDFAMVFVTKQSELKREFARIEKQLATAGLFWIAWPKKTSKMPTDMNENDVRRIGLEMGLVDIKVCAVSETWSGLKFVRRLQDRSRS